MRPAGELCPARCTPALLAAKSALSAVRDRVCWSSVTREDLWESFTKSAAAFR